MDVKEGKCPMCGADLEYSNIGLQDRNFFYEVTCTECEWSGKEWYVLTFDGFTDEAGEEINGEVLPFKVWIRWGEDSTQRETYATPRDATLYEFSTQAELSAFLEGVDAMDGYLDYNSFQTKEELDAEPESYED
jgi:hypothetical protein